MNEVKMIIKDEYIDRLRSGNPLLETNLFVSPQYLNKEGDILKLVSDKGRFLARGYYGIQNRGCGWVLSRHRKEKIGYDFFKRTINSSISKRKNLYGNNKTTAYRLFNGEGDGIGGLTIDAYGGYFLIQWYSKGIYKFRDLVIDILKKRDPDKGIFEKRRFGEGGKYIFGKDFILGNYPYDPLTVTQDGIRYLVNLDDGPMTGLFLDQRHVRRGIKEEYALGKETLNLFSYTGAFGVAAALGGAAGTTNVDVAQRSVEMTKQNYIINGLDLSKQETVVSDVFAYLDWAQKRQKKWDLIILDPPSFSRSKGRVFQAEKDYESLIEKAQNLLSYQGILIASVNSAKLEKQKFLKQVKRPFQSSKRKVSVKKIFQLPEDFSVHPQHSQSNYLKVAVLKADV